MIACFSKTSCQMNRVSLWSHLTASALAGTSSIVDEKTHEPLLPILTLIVDTAFKLRKNGHRVVIVSSGAIGVGLRRMDVDKRPKHLAQLQVCSPVPIAP